MTAAALKHELIRASAGAGKTYELTSRYIDLLRLGVEPRQILATTFTRKAAGEILQRLLWRLADEDAPQLLAVVCRNLHGVAIGTIDSFFGRMAGCFHHELDLPINPTMMGEGDALAAQLRAQAIDAMLADDDLPVLLDLMQRLYHDSARRGVTDFIDEQVSSLYQVYREAPHPDAWAQVKPMAAPDDRVFEAAVAELIAARDRWTASIAKAIDQSVDLLQKRDFKTFLGKGVAAAVFANKDKYGRTDIDDDLRALHQPLVDYAIADLVNEVLHRTEALYDLLRRYDKHYTELRQRHRALLYSDLPYRLAERMNLDDELMMQMYYRLDQRVSHLLLDEFQDTSVQQWDILRPFAEEITSTENRSLFCVGDTKQAIYGWRGGCAKIFDQLQDDLYLPPEAVTTRSTSYRSAQPVLAAVNKVFEELAALPAFRDHRKTAGAWQTRFHPHVAHHAAKRGCVRLTTSLPGDHIEYVAQQVEELAMQAPGHDVGVLMRTNDVAAKLIDRLHRRDNVRASGEGGAPVTDDPAVAAVLSALTMADHPGHTAAAYHVANSPLGAIIGLRSAETREVDHVAAQLRGELLERGYAKVISDWTRALAPSCDARNVARLTQLVELADRYDPDMTLRPSDFVAFAHATPVEEPTPAPVRVMTVHKAKGLEFDIVVLPQLERKLGQVAAGSVTMLRDAPTSPVRAVFAATNELVRSACPPLAEAHEKEVIRRFNDDLCALYVAMTRARHGLHLIVEPLKAKKDGSPGSLGLCAAAILREALGAAGEHFDGDQVLYEHGDAGWFVGDEPPAPPEVPVEPKTLTVNLKPSDRATRSWRVVAPSSLKDAKRANLDDLLDLGDVDGRAFGSAIHEWFEQVEYLPAEPPVLPDDAPPEWTDAFHAMLTKPAVIEALSHPGGKPILWRERKFAVRLGDELVRGVFDRVVITPERIDLIDFKTDARVDEYRPQMQTYTAALAAMLDVPEDRIRTRLLLVTAGECVEV